ncbi:hypothetical protein EAO77_35415 [Streptomyces sp. t39]|nr:hypothetical protein EAO77_35415 [Streptomyces sp. t39]
MGTALVRRPTEDAALSAACRTLRPLPQIPMILADLLAANRAGDRRGVNLCAHLAARASLGQVGE